MGITMTLALQQPDSIALCGAWMLARCSAVHHGDDCGLCYLQCKASAESTTSFEGAVCRGVVLEAQGRWEEAILDYRTVLKAVPEDPSAWNNLGNASAGLGRCAWPPTSILQSSQSSSLQLCWLLLLPHQSQ